MEKLKSAYTTARTGRPQVVGIIAESGYGKTRLVQEFFAWLFRHSKRAEPEEIWKAFADRQQRTLAPPGIGHSAPNSKKPDPPILTFETPS